MTLTEDAITLTFTPDNPCNTTITSALGDVLYSVVTEHTKKATFTQVRDANDEVVASLEWRDVLPDKVTIGHGKPVSFSEWMKKSFVPFKDQATFSDDMGRKYKWVGIGPGRTISLYSQDDGFAVPIAQYHRSRRVLPSQLLSRDQETPSFTPMTSTYSLSPTLTDGQSITPTLTDARSIRSVDTQGRRTTVARTPGRLELMPRGQEVAELVVLTILFIEKQNRLRRADMGDATSFGGLYNGVTLSGAC